ncbi:MAG: hypothetical protein ACRC35_06765 [Angustibacter sp.]
MGFFLRMTWPWWLLAAIIAALIAWWVHRFGRRSSADDSPSIVSDERVAALKARIAELEGTQADTDALKARIAELESARADVAPAPLGAAPRADAAEPDAAEATPSAVVAEPAVAEPDTSEPAVAEPEVAEPEVAEPEVAEPEVAEPEVAEPEVAEATPPAVVAEPDAIPDVAVGGSVIGRPLKLDDLTVVEGIGPKIQGLLHAINVRTWRDLSRTPVETLKEMLNAAGPRYQIHNPDTWPRQAQLLADGKWDEFKSLTDSLRGGRTV